MSRILCELPEFGTDLLLPGEYPLFDPTQRAYYPSLEPKYESLLSLSRT